MRNRKDKVHNTLIIGKAGVTPFKQVTVPRCKVNAARIAAPIDRMLTAKLQIQLEETLFCVLVSHG